MFEKTLVPGQLPLMLRIDPLVVLQSLLFGSVWLVLCLLVILSSRTFGSLILRIAMGGTCKNLHSSQWRWCMLNGSARYDERKYIFVHGGTCTP